MMDELENDHAEQIEMPIMRSRSDACKIKIPRIIQQVSRKEICLFHKSSSMLFFVNETCMNAVYARCVGNVYAADDAPATFSLV